MKDFDLEYVKEHWKEAQSGKLLQTRDGKPVRLLVNNENLQIYYSTDLIAVHKLSTKRLNYISDHYKQLLSNTIKSEDAIEELAEKNLQQMDLLL